LTAEENLAYLGVLKGMLRSEALSRGAELVKRFGLEHKRDAVVQKLSRGMQQKVALVNGTVYLSLGYVVFGWAVGLAKRRGLVENTEAC
jgi:ABC-type Na+ transport system ATPase subunit NatA